MMAARQADFDAGDLADEAVADDLRRLAEGRLRALPGAGLPDALVLLHGFDNGLLLGNGAGQRFLAVNVLLVPGGFDGDQGMPMVRHGQHHGVNVLARHHLAVIVVGLAVLVLVMAVDLVQRLLEMVLVQVAGGDDLAVFHAQKRLRVAGALHAPAHHAHR